MPALIHLITHPEVVIDPDVPVPRWSLAPRGIARMRALAAEAEMASLTSIWASTETKAIEAAGLLAAAHGLAVHVHPGLGENDRSATGYLPAEAFEAAADAFFAAPEQSIDGWERAVDAQARMVAAMGEVLAAAPAGDVAIVAHGGVGALLRAWLAGAPISRFLDQPSQGCRYAIPRDAFAIGGASTAWVPLPKG